MQLEGTSVRARFADTDTQIKAKDAIAKALNPDPADPSYIVALNLVSRSPQWMASVHALPMYLGLDLRGGVHFLMQVDMKAALTKRAEAYSGDARTLLRDKGIRAACHARRQQRRRARARQGRRRRRAQPPDRQPARPGLDREAAEGDDFKLTGTLKPEAGDASRTRPSSRTSPRCTTASTNSAWPSR